MKPIILSILLFLTTAGVSQSPDSLTKSNDPIELLYQWLFDERSGIDADALGNDDADQAFEELMDSYLQLQESPVNINSEEIVRLEEIGLLNAFQNESLRQYRRQYGDLLFMEELLMVEGFNETVVAVISPLVYFGKNENVQELEKITVGKAIGSGKHQVTLNYAEQFGGDGDNKCLGSPRKLQMNYRCHYKQKLRFGIAMEKDAGEPFFFSHMNDSLKELITQYRKPGFDFYGAHVYVTDVSFKKTTSTSKNSLIIKDLALGDYQISVGQGLTLWTGMGFGKAAGGSSPMKRGAGVRPKASSSESTFFRGGAATLRYRDFYFTGFYSIRNIDGSSETGYHRTLNELAKRNAVRQQVFGGRLCYSGPHLELGYTVSSMRLGTSLELTPSKYNQFYFQGDRLTNMGLDFRWLLGNTAFFGELAHSSNGAFAGLVGMTMKPTGYINFSVLYRNYDKRYQNLFSAAFSESSRGQGEKGFYLGLQCAPAPRWELLSYCDFFKMTWLGSQVYTPSWGQEYSLKVTHQLSNTASMQLRVKSKTKMKNTTDAYVFSHYPVFFTKRTVHFQISYGIGETLVFSDKLSYSHYLDGDDADSKGYFIAHDIAFKPPDKPYSLTLRYALFKSDDYNSRISMYENDVLGAFSIPSLSGLGSRIYLLGKFKLFDCVSIYSRIGCSLLSEETKIDLKVELVGTFRAQHKKSN